MAAAPNPIRAVIFDMDGVLIDSEIVYLNYQVEHLRSDYPWVTPESLLPTVGMSGVECRRFLAALLRRPQDADFARFIDELFAGCQVDYPAILRPQVPALLQTLRQRGYLLALASSSSPENIHTVLSQCGIESYFHSIVSGDEFRRSKPDPEIYRFTMARLGLRPEQCLVVEDSTYGVQAGAAAGALVAALRDDRFPFDQHLAALHLASLDDLFSLLPPLT